VGTTGSSEIVPFLSGPQRRTLPLLPFERELIDTLGCSPEEYRRFTEEALWRAQRRPAAYDHIPDIRCDPVSILINLAIGIALSAVSALLAPKPKEATQIQQRKLKNSNQVNRFNSTYGFDSISELAEYGQRIAIPFGRYGIYGDRTTGGLVAGPALVWSRMFSYGKSQGIKALFAVGERLQCQPDLAGIFLGNSPLDVVFKESFAVYWSRGEGRIHAKHLLYGSRGRRDSGDPQTSDDAFLCPTAEGSDEPGFSCVYTPSNNTSFGVYGAIPNGTAYRVNWRVVSCPSIKDADDDPQGTIRYERRKIAGKECDEAGGRGAGGGGMPGLGRGYGRRMGLVGHNGTFMTVPTRVTVAVGHKVQFRIFAYELTRAIADISGDSGVEVEDINNAIQDECIAADDAMQVGETFLIGRTLWKVIDRPDETFRRLRSRKETEPLDYILECTELLGGVNEIGIAGGKAINAAIVSEGLTLNTEDGWLGPSYYPLLKVDLGVVRNVRRTDATEIGIRSQVWNRANGLCNFSVVPTPSKLKSLDDDSVNLSGGTMSRYFDRTSAFTIFLRPAGLQPDGTEYKWVALGEQFCVTGNRPVDKYNYIRIKARTPGRYEYRIIPKCGADVRQYTPLTEAFWELDATSSTILGADYSTAYGDFRVTTTGREVAAGDLLANRELQTRSGQSATGEWKNMPQALTRLEWLPSSVTVGRHAGYMTEFLGEADASPQQTKSATKTVTVGSKTITIRLTAYSESVAKTGNWAFFLMWSRQHYWVEQRLEVVSSTGSWRQGEQFDHIIASPSNGFISIPFGCRYQVSSMGLTFIPPNPYSSQRIFEHTSRIADISHYSELEKSNASNAEHEIVYVNESVSNASTPNYDGMTLLGLALKSGRSYQQLDQVRAWVPDGVPVYRCLDGSRGPSNLFCDLAYHLLTDKVMGLGATISPDLIKVEDMQLTAKFLTANRIHFDGVLSDAQNVRSLLVELAPLNLCSFVIAGGQFSVVPALPCNADGSLNAGAVQVQGIFTDGNIIDGSYQLDYLNAEERRDIKAVVTYRRGPKNSLSQERTVTVKWNEPAADTHPQETFDLTLFCTNREQAILVGQYMLSLRRRVTHMVKFKTTPYGMNLAPGQLIRVDTESSPYSATLNGVVGLSGELLSATPLADGTYQVLAYKQGSEQVETVSLTVANGEVADPTQRGMLFTRQSPVRERNVYLIEELTLDEDGLVDVSASHFPTDNALKSTIVADMLSTTAWEILD
jgi:hypothetical protein